jgi:hypothetical protein
VRTVRKLSLIAIALLLAACEQQQGDAPAAGETPPLVTDQTEGDTPPERTPEPLSVIPDRYHGAWDAVSGSCAPASDLRLEIEARQIVFYESVGKVTATRSEGADAIADLAMEGEGEEWFRSVRLKLAGTPDGERLQLVDAIERPDGEPIPLRRCPA